MNRTDKEGVAGGLQSPTFFRRKDISQTDSTGTAQGKVVLGEVEEKLKSMRQKRLDRLSTFVAEQSKLSEERGNKDKEGNEIEDAIISMKQSSKEEKNITTFKTITEENSTQSKLEDEERNDRSNVPRTPKLFRKFSNESVDKSKQVQKHSSTKKFISKFNCATMQPSGASIEDLTTDNEYKKSNVIKPLDVSENSHSKIQPNYNRNSVQEEKRKVIDDTSKETENIQENYNPLLSPVGKQRRGIYLYEAECTFLENERLSTLSTFKKVENIQEGSSSSYSNSANNNGDVSLGKLQEKQLSEFGNVSLDLKLHEKEKNPVMSTFKKIEKNQQVSIAKSTTSTENLSPSKPQEEQLSGHDKTFLSLKSSSHAHSQNKGTEEESSLLLKSFKRKSLSDILNENKVNLISSFNRKSADELRYHDNRLNQSISNTATNKCDGKITEHPRIVTYENVDLKSVPETATNSSNNKIQKTKQSPESTGPASLRNPIPVPRKFSNEERVFKKFQRNWDSLNEILENDSDVDFDEIEDLKKTLEDTSTLLEEYGNKLKQIQGKSKDKSDQHRKLNDAKAELTEIEKEISNFRGLRRDSKYQQLSNKLSNCLSQIIKIKTSKVDLLRQKNVLLTEAENYLKILENKVIRNENLLIEVLEAQVTSISTNIFNITKV